MNSYQCTVFHTDEKETGTGGERGAFFNVEFEYGGASGTQENEAPAVSSDFQGKAWGEGNDTRRDAAQAGYCECVVCEEQRETQVEAKRIHSNQSGCESKAQRSGTEMGREESRASPRVCEIVGAVEEDEIKRCDFMRVEDYFDALEALQILEQMRREG